MNTQVWHLRIRSIKVETLRNILRITLILLPIIHLILSPIHVGALLKLENEISGFLMFLSILFGLVVLFQATRMKPENPLSEFLCILGIIAVVGITFALLLIYNDALHVQKSLNNPEAIHKAIALCSIVCIIFSLGAVTLIIDLVLLGKRKKLL